MCNISNLYKPEYIALAVSVIAVFVNVYIAWRNRKHALVKEEYFKLQQVAERIISKLLFLENHREKLKIFIKYAFKASQKEQSVFIDTNDTFNKADFEQDGEEIVALIDIYFNNLGNDWNFCLDKMSALFTQSLILNDKLKQKQNIVWKTEIENFNKLSLELGVRPKEIGDRIKLNLKEFKEKNL